MLVATMAGARKTVSAHFSSRRPAMTPGTVAAASSQSSRLSGSPKGLASAQAVDSGADEPPPVRGEGEHHGGQGPEMEGHVEGEAVLGPAEEPGHHDEVARAADGQELAQALHHAENDRLEQTHRPATPR